MLHPRGVYLVDHFLTVTEADSMVLYSMDKFSPRPVQCKGYPESWCEIRLSQSHDFQYDSNGIGKQFRKKVEGLTRVPSQFYEDLLTTRYSPGQFYTNHYDSTPCSEQLSQFPESCNSTDRRMVTVIVYLNENAGGGGSTYFPDLVLRVTPKAGAAVVFFPVTLDGFTNPFLRHSSEVAFKTKYVAQQWISLDAARVSV